MLHCASYFEKQQSSCHDQQKVLSPRSILVKERRSQDGVNVNIYGNISSNLIQFNSTSTSSINYFSKAPNFQVCYSFQDILDHIPTKTMAFRNIHRNGRGDISKTSSAYSTQPASDYTVYSSSKPLFLNLCDTSEVQPQHHVVQDINTKIGFLAFQLHNEQQKTTLLEQIIKMQEEKIKVLQSKTSFVCTPEPEEQQPIDHHTIRYELEAAQAKAIFLEDKCMLQERIISLQQGWIEDLQYNGCDEVEVDMGEESACDT
jgi:hypothetical protein